MRGWGDCCFWRRTFRDAVGGKGKWDFLLITRIHATRPQGSEADLEHAHEKIRRILKRTAADF